MVESENPVSMIGVIECENPVSMGGGGVVKGGARAGAGAKALPAEQKMVAYKISATPADWEYLGLFLPADIEQRTPGHLFRAGLERLRLHCPNGPDKPFFVPDPAAPKKPRLTPAVSRYASRLGISKAEAMNRAWAVFEASELEQAQKDAPHR